MDHGEETIHNQTLSQIFFQWYRYDDDIFAFPLARIDQYLHILLYYLNTPENKIHYGVSREQIDNFLDTKQIWV